MLNTWQPLIAYSIFAVLDSVCYLRTPWPQRARWYYFLLPGGGVAAYLRWRCGRASA